MCREKKNKLRNSNFLPILFFMIIIGMGGFLLIKIIDARLELTNKSIGDRLFTPAFVILCMYFAAFIQNIVHECGHLIFGKLSRYKFVYFRIGKLMLISDKGKYKLKRFSLVGTGIQCLMMPPGSKGDEYPYISYKLGGVIVQIVFSLLCLLLYKLMPQVNYFSDFFSISAVIGIIFALMNGMPMYLWDNDGNNALSLRKNCEVKRAFWLQLYIIGLVANGTRLADMSEELFQLPKKDDLSNPIICTIGAFKCSYLQDKKLFDEAKEMCEFMLENALGLHENLKNELRCDLLFYEIMGLCRREEIDRLYTKQLKKYIKATSSYVSRKRLMYAYALLLEGDVSKAEKELEGFEKAAKVYPYEIEVQCERELIAIVDEKWSTAN